MLLDEIGELSLPMQVKLLRVLQEHKLRQVGSSAEKPFAARILAATNRPLDQLVKDLGGSFHVIDDEDAVTGVLNFAYTQFVTQLVVGESLRSRVQELLRGSFVNEIIRKANNVDIHVIARRER